jgi:hypothetical protein
MSTEHYVLIHGRGGSLGDFKLFSDTLKKQIAISNKNAKVTQAEITRRTPFLDYLLKWPTTDLIKELHIFSHSIGAGLFLGYGDPILARDRVNLLATVAASGSIRPGFDDVRKTEEGAIFTDDLIIPPFSSEQAKLQKKLAVNGTIKIWGCNSGVSGWIYSDEDAAGNYIVDPADTSAVYYWRALNERNQPKPSLAKAFAGFFGKTVYGAQSGADIHVYDSKSKTWMSTTEYRKTYKKVPSGTLPHQLVPSRGGYGAFLPLP